MRSARRVAPAVPTSLPARPLAIGPGVRASRTGPRAIRSRGRGGRPQGDPRLGPAGSRGLPGPRSDAPGRAPRRWPPFLRPLVGLLVLAATLTGCSDDPSTPPSPDPVPLGVHPLQRGIPGGDPLLVEAYGDVARDGFAFAQLELEWGRTERSLGNYDWSAFDAHLRQARTRDLDLSVVVLLVEGERIGALPDDLRGQDLSSPNLRVRYARFLLALLERARGQVRWLWTGREVDRRLVLHPGESAAFRDLLRAAVDSVRTVEPGVRLGVSLRYDEPAPLAPLAELAPEVDVIGWSVWGVDERYEAAGDAGALAARIRDAVALRGGSPTFITETGFRRRPDPTEAVDYARRLTDDLATAPEGLEGVVWFALYDFHAEEAALRATRIHPDEPERSAACAAWLRDSGLREVSGTETALSSLVREWNLGR